MIKPCHTVHPNGHSVRAIQPCLGFSEGTTDKLDPGSGAITAIINFQLQNGFCLANEPSAVMPGGGHRLAGACMLRRDHCGVVTI